MQLNKIKQPPPITTHPPPPSPSESGWQVVEDFVFPRQLNLLFCIVVNETDSKMMVVLSVPEIHNYPKHLIKMDLGVQSVAIRIQDLKFEDYFMKIHRLAKEISVEKSKYEILPDTLVLHLHKERPGKWRYLHYHHPEVIDNFEKKMKSLLSSEHFTESVLDELSNIIECSSYYAYEIHEISSMFNIILPETVRTVNEILNYMKQRLPNPLLMCEELLYYLIVLFSKKKKEFEETNPEPSQSLKQSEKRNDMTKENVRNSRAEGLKEEGNAHFRANRFKEAIEAYTKAITLDPQSAAYFLNRSIVHFKMKSIPKCIIDAAQAIKINPFYSKAYFYLGKAYLAICYTVKASLCFRLAKHLDINMDIDKEMKKLNNLDINIQNYIQAVKNQNRFQGICFLNKISKDCIATYVVGRKTVEELCSCNMINLAKLEINLYFKFVDSVFGQTEQYYLLGLCSYYEDDEESAYSYFKKSLSILPENYTCIARYSIVKEIYELRAIADQYFDDHDYERAVHWYLKGLKDGIPSNVSAKFSYKIACSKLKLKENEEALMYFNKAIHQREDYHEAFAARGELYMNEGKFKEASLDLKRAGEIYPSDRYKEMIIEIEEKRGTRHSKSNDKSNFCSIDETNSKEFKLQKALAECKKVNGNKHFKAGRYEDAIRAYTEAINLDSCSAVLYSNRSACYIMLKNYKEALKDSESALNIDPLLVKGLIRRNTCYVALGDIENAIKCLEKSCKMKPLDKTFINELSKVKELKEIIDKGLSALNNKEYEIAEKHFSRAVSKAEMCERFHKKKIDCLINMEKFEDAISAAQYAISLNINNSEIYYLMGLCYFYKGMKNEAVEFLEKSLSLNPSEIKVSDTIERIKSLYSLIERGDEMYSQKRLNEALSCYVEGLKLVPKNKKLRSICHYKIGLAYKKEKKLKEAISNFTSSVELHESYVDAYIRRAECYVELTEFEKAIKDYETLNKIFPCEKYKKLILETEGKSKTYAEDLNEKKLEEALAECKIKKGDKKVSEKSFEEAIKWFTEATLLSPNSIRAFVKIGQCHVILGNTEKATIAFEKATNLDSSNEEVIDSLVKCLKLKESLKAASRAEVNEEYLKAFEYYNHASKIAFGSSLLLLKSAQCLIRLQRLAEVSEVIDSVPDELKESADILFIKALFAYHNDHKEEASGNLIKILQIDPLNENAKNLQIRMNLVYGKKKQGDEAFMVDGNSIEAQKCYEEGLKIDSENYIFQAKFYHNIGVIQMNRKDLVHAIASFTQAIEYKNEYINALEKRAKCYKRITDTENAIEDYKKLYQLTSSKTYLEELKRLETKLEQSTSEDYYKILKVSHEATMDDIRKSYKKLAKEFHPDRMTEESAKVLGEERFKRISKAYSVLSDPLKRERYDRGESEEEEFSQFHFSHNHFMQFFFSRRFASENSFEDDDHYY